MDKFWGILSASCLCALLAGGGTVYADVERSLYPVTLVAAQEDYTNIAVSQVSDYVNIRQEPNTGSAVVGKIYNNCAATILETVSGEGGEWYRIQSGSVSGYIKAQYFITGSAAEALALQIGREFATVDAEGLRLRERPDPDSAVLTYLSNGARYLVQGIEGEFYKVEVDADLVGYIARQYCKTQVEFDQAVSVEEEQQKLAEEQQRKQDSDNAIAALELVRQEALVVEPHPSGGGAGRLVEANPGSNGSYVAIGPPPGISSGNANGPAPGSPALAAAGPGPSVVSSEVASATRTAVVAYARQFLGRPYAYGGTSLTNGTDCSGFTQGVYAHFGITTGRSSRDQAQNGRSISITAAQPGDLLFYSSGSSGYINHVAMYIGNGQIIHAATEATGICTAPYDYRTPCKAVTFLD